jgi:ATP phosphoribosyltransferase regulatory subunit
VVKGSLAVPQKVGLQLPHGMRDLLPGDTKLIRDLENLFVDRFSRWGYFEVITPVLEYYENLLPAETPEDQFFKLIDREGQILAMRTDMTTPIARMVAAKMGKEQFPFRVFYLANVFRYEHPQRGRQREFFQAGVELIGDPAPTADAEVIALAVECLKEAGLEDFKISIGQVNFLKGIIDSMEVDSAIKDKITWAVSRKDFVELEMFLNKQRIDPGFKKLILSLPALRGGVQVIDQVLPLTENITAREALENLREVFHLLEVYGVGKEVFVDFGIMRDFDYYSGIVFEGYSPGVGAPICGGGRYDRMLGKYGLDAPATGFAIGMERLMLALEAEHQVDRLIAVDYLVVSSDPAQAVRKAQELRQQGFSVLVAGQGQDLPVAARKKLEL